MIIVLLPGMDGTGVLFEPLVKELTGFESFVMPLPNQGPQEYNSLADYIFELLPKEPFVLLGESFSGPLVALLGARIAERKISSLKGIVFIATFLNPPSALFTKLAANLPLKSMLNLPLSSWLLKRFMLGGESTKSNIEHFRKVVCTVPSQTLHARLKTLSSFKICLPPIQIPALYLCASGDKLVSPRAIEEFKKRFNMFEVVWVNGPHFILQARPKECAEIIKKFVDDVQN